MTRSCSVLVFLVGFLLLRTAEAFTFGYQLEQMGKLFLLLIAWFTIGCSWCSGLCVGPMYKVTFTPMGAGAISSVDLVTSEQTLRMVVFSLPFSVVLERSVSCGFVENVARGCFLGSRWSGNHFRLDTAL